MIKEPKKVGFWSGPQDYVIDGIRNKREKRELKACLYYISKSRQVKRYKGWANCRLCGKRLGSCDMETPDGKFLFPQRFEHYLIEHNVEPPRRSFIKAAIKFYKENQNNDSDNKRLLKTKKKRKITE